MTYNVFFNRDCMKFGIQNENGQQVLIKTKTKQERKDAKCYTKYKAVALRWCDRMNTGIYCEWTY